MAGSTQAFKIGVIAEEQNDFDVIYALACKVVKANQFSCIKFLGHGCGKLRRKSTAWAQNLLDRGCSHLVVVHDRDRAEEQALRRTLNQLISDIPFKKSIILIPVEEMESWLLSDAAALQTVFRMQRLPKVPRWPERIANPKKHLANVVTHYSKSQYLNTVHNQKIAQSLSITKLDRCPSFSQLPDFLKSIFPASALLQP